jgi:hypothetical protein
VNDQGYEDWRRRRERSDVPAGFSDRVMAAVEAQEAGRRRAGLLLAALLASRLSRIGLCSLAAATCVFRLWHVVAVFVAQ